jgi:hypothetical protein
MLCRMRSARGGAVGGSLLLATLVSVACGGIESPDVDGRPVGGSSAGRGPGGSAGASATAGRGGGATVPSPDAGVGGSSGSSAAETPPDAGVRSNEPPRAYCDAIEEVFRFKCGPSCHQNVDFKSGDFAVGPAEARDHVDRVSARGAQCGLVIDSRNPQNSLILTKITGDYPPNNCGGAMPIGSFEITDGEIDCISDWLEQYAR